MLVGVIIDIFHVHVQDIIIQANLLLHCRDRLSISTARKSLAMGMMTYVLVPTM